VEKSIAIHVFSSMKGDVKGELYDSLKHDMERYVPCVSRVPRVSCVPRVPRVPRVPPIRSNKTHKKRKN
jgi:hypothetical protein